MNIRTITIICVAIAATFLLGGCRSKKATSSTARTPETVMLSPVEEVASDLWGNVYSPVTVDIIQPTRFTISGRMTMVRGESIYLSLRMFGMEVGSAYSTPSEAVMSMKLPKKLMMELPMESMLQRAGVSFTDVQEALLGNEDALAKLPQAVTYKAETTDSKSVVELYATYAGKPLAVRFTWDLRSAKWNIDSPARWSAPGSGYVKVTPAEALKMAGSLLN